MDHELKDYESERERNIERNKSFLSLLAVGQINTALIKSEEAVDTDGCAPGDVVVLEESSADFSRLCKAALASCKEQYPFRNKEAERIVSYIEQGAQPMQDIQLPALMLYGNSGSGKSAICQYLLQQTRILHAYVLCTCYSDCLQILQALWDSMQSSVDTCFSAAGKQPPSLRNKSFNRSKKITFSTLHDCIRGFMDTLGLTKFVLVMDHIDYLRSLDADVANKLLLMSELVHPGLKVIGIRRNLLHVDCSQSITISFNQYSDADIIQIITTKVSKLADEAILKSPSRVVSPSLGRRNSPLRPTATPAGDHPASNQEVLQFRQVLQDIMPRLRMTTGHVDDIMNIALLVWGIASKHDALARGSASVSSAVSAATAQSVLRLPFLRYDNNNCGPDMLLQEREHSIDAESLRGVRWVGDIPYKARYLLIAAYLASKIARESDKFTFGDEKKGRRKRSRGGVESQVDGPHAGASDPSLQYAPQSFTLERLLAIFKHIYESNHRMYDEESKVTQTASSVPFSTDVVTTHHTHTLVLNGDDRFMAMINMLERLNFITAAVSWRDDQPVYYCAIERDTVKIIARSVHFPMENYVPNF